MKTINKTLFTCAILASLSLVPCLAQDGPVAEYPFHGTARDVSGNGNNGTAIKAQLTTDRFGMQKSAYAFHGNGSRIVVPNSPSLAIEGSAITIAAWVLPTQLTGQGERRTILRKMPPTGAQGGYLLALNGQGYPQFGFRTQSANFFESTATNYALASNGWTHVAVTYDGAAARFFLNGNLTDALPLGGDIGAGTEPLVMGQLGRTNANDAFHGSLDEVRIYNRALDASEVSQLFRDQTNFVPVAKIIARPIAKFPGITNHVVLARNNESARVILNASKSKDNQPLKYAWSDNGEDFSTNSVTTRILPLGTHVITLTVDDGTAQDTDTVVLDVIGTQYSVGLLIDMINQSGLSQGRARNLLATLNAAANASPNRLNARTANLRVFLQKVRAQLSRTNPVLAANLIQATQLIINADNGL